MAVVYLILLFLFAPVLSSAQLTWKQLIATNTKTGPEPRRDCAIGYDQKNGKIFIFGGRGSGLFDDTWSFDLTTRTWKQVTTTDNPGKRFSVVSGIWNNGFYVSTGQQGSVFFNDIWRLDLDLGTFVWSKLPPGSTTIPEQRYGSAGGLFQQGNSSLFFLTHGFSGVRYSNTFVYDVSRNDGWREVFAGTHPYNPNYPHARCLHSATMLSRHKLIMYGGCMGGGGTGGPCPADDSWTFDSSEDKWTRLPHCASPRTYSAMALLPTDKDDANATIVRAVLYGGGETSQSVVTVSKAKPNEVVVFNAENEEWSKKIVIGTAPLKRTGAAMVTVGDGIIMFGGGSSDGLQNDVWLLEGTSKMADKSPDGEECNLTYFTYIELHGVFMFFGWGVFLQLGMFFGRYFRHKDPWWFKMHRGFQITGLIVALIGFAFAIKSVPNGHFKFAHGALGLVIMIIGMCQPLNAFFRPHKSDPPTLKRKIWEIYHINAGRVALLLALINISLGVFFAVIPYVSWVIWFVMLALWLTVLIIMETRLQIMRYNVGQITAHVEMSDTN